MNNVILKMDCRLMVEYMSVLMFVQQVALCNSCLCVCVMLPPAGHRVSMLILFNPLMCLCYETQDTETVHKLTV